MKRNPGQTKLAAWKSERKKHNSQKLLTQSLLLSTHILQSNASLKDLVLICSSTGKKKEIQKLPLSKTNLLRESSRYGQSKNNSFSRTLFPTLVSSKHGGSYRKFPKSLPRNNTTLSLFNRKKATLRSRFSKTGSFVLSQTNRILNKKQKSAEVTQYNLNKFLTKSSLQKYFGSSNQKLPSLAPLNTLCLNFDAKAKVPEQYPKMKVFESLKGQNLDLSRQIQTSYHVKKKNKKFSKKNSEKLFRKLFLIPKKNDLIKMKKTASAQKLMEISEELGMGRTFRFPRRNYRKFSMIKSKKQVVRGHKRGGKSLDLNAVSRKRNFFSPLHQRKLGGDDENENLVNSQRKIQDMVYDDRKNKNGEIDIKKSKFSKIQPVNLSQKILKTDNFKIEDSTEKNEILRNQIVNFEDQKSLINKFMLWPDNDSNLLFTKKLTLMSLLVSSVMNPVSHETNMGKFFLLGH